MSKHVNHGGKRVLPSFLSFHLCDCDHAALVYLYKDIVFQHWNQTGFVIMHNIMQSLYGKLHKNFNVADCTFVSVPL